MTLESLDTECDRLVRNEVIVCLSAMVSTLAGGYGSLENEDSRRRPQVRELSSLCDQAAELCTPILDFDEAAIEAGWHRDREAGVWRKNSDPERSQYEFATDVCEEEGFDAYEREIFEHWSVSTWLAEKLAAKGERVDMDFAGLCVWGRTTTGQGVDMDSVIQDIVRELHGVKTS